MKDQYDATLQMYVDKDLQINRKKLDFMRWMAEQGKLEHPLAGPSSGELTEDSHVEVAA